MIKENSSLFDRFKAMQENFDVKNAGYMEKFNEDGNKVLRVIRRYENELCSKSENSGFGKFSANLSDLFWGEVRLYLPHIDQVSLQ